MQLSVFADLESATWDVAVDGRWLGDGPGDHPVLEFADFDATAIGSARLIVVWLRNGDTYSLSALRPSGAKGQDKDQITVALPEPGSGGEPALSVFDPRLSTEYSDTGVPQRFGVELWLGTDPEGDQHPVRLGGESVSTGEPLRDGPLTIHPMRTHSGDQTGLGLYLLVTG